MKYPVAVGDRRLYFPAQRTGIHRRKDVKMHLIRSYVDSTRIYSRKGYIIMKIMELMEPGTW